MRTPTRLAAAVVPALLAVAPVTACSGTDAEPARSASASASSSADPSAGDTPTATPTGTPTDTGTATGSGTATATASGSGPATTTAATPSGAVATGTLAAGFPTDVVPLLPDSTITVSTVTPVEAGRTVSLSGTTATPADQVLAFYRAALTAQGFTETAAGAQAAGFPTATFSRNSGADLLVLTVATLEGVQSFTLGGALAG